jgi:GNAT superfamily N-acetyltransferase
MEIEDLNEENLKDIVKPCICKEWIEKFAKWHNIDIERVREGFSKGAELRIDWIKKRVPLGYKAKIAYEQGRPIGFIDYSPMTIAKEVISGQDVNLINCINIIPSYRDKGYGRLLLREAETDVEKVSKGIAVIAHNNPGWMPVSFFAKWGYNIVDERNGKIKEILMLKTFRPVQRPSFLKSADTYKPKIVSGKVTVEILWSGACPHNLICVKLLKEVLNEFGDKISVKEVATNDLASDVIRKYGHCCGVYLNGKPNFWLLGASKNEVRQEIENNL